MPKKGKIRSTNIQTVISKMIIGNSIGEIDYFMASSFTTILRQTHNILCCIIP